MILKRPFLLFLRFFVKYLCFFKNTLAYLKWLIYNIVMRNGKLGFVGVLRLATNPNLYDIKCGRTKI
jgi:hypothetical protein